MFKKQNKMLRAKVCDNSQERSNESRPVPFLQQPFENRKNNGNCNQSQVSQRSASANLVQRKQGAIDELPVKQDKDRNYGDAYSRNKRFLNRSIQNCSALT